MSRWWRAYDDAVENPKLQRLSADLFRAWFNLMCLASKGDGWLPAIEDIAFRLRTTVPRAQRLLDELTRCDLFDEIDGRLKPHNWDARQFVSDVSTERVKRHRKRKRNVSSAVSETPPDTETDTDTEKMPPEDLSSGAVSSEETDLFRRGKQVLGQSAGGLIRNLLRAKGGNIPLARAAIEQASTKQDSREYIGRVIRGHDPPSEAAYRW